MRRPMTIPRKARGVSAVIVAIAIVVLVGFAGLALDSGRLFIHKTELQNAVDACALAAARELNEPVKTLAVFTRAENAGITVAARNLANFQHAAVALEPDRDVTFCDALNGTYVTKDAAPANTQYVRCTTQLTGILPWFMQVLGIGANAVDATAVASMQPGNTACALPMGMCMPPPPAPPCTVPGVTPDANGLCKGQWYSGRFGSGGGASGSFNWLDFPPFTGGGANELKEAIQSCTSMIALGDSVHAETGMNESVATVWNTYFGLYKTGGGNPQPADSAPDFSGYAYTDVNWPTGHDAYPDFATKRTGNVSYGPTTYTTQEGNQLTGLSISNAYKASAPAVHAKGADRRVIAMPAVNCSGWGPAHATTVQGWACALMLNPVDGPNDNVVLEYLGIPGEPGVPCGTYGHSGGPSGTGPRVPTLVQ